ncbi:MAG: hypothetical protein WDN67_01965 [Candidatus Moraniibacteriota bacterium]
MKSVERRFREVKEKQPLWSSYLCFCEAVRDAGFEKQPISRWLNKLVEKDDYAGSKRAVLAFLAALSKPLRATEMSLFRPQEARKYPSGLLPPKS